MADKKCMVFLALDFNPQLMDIGLKAAIRKQKTMQS
jgi:hypothetical protein